MAMRGRGGGRGNPNRLPRVIVNRVYEQFNPMSEWRQEEDYDTLLIYLPGFQKEYIKVTTEDSNIVRVRGERLVNENKWSRFQEDYRVPENCEMRGIRAKFDGGILTITMPRKVGSAPPLPPTTTTPTPPPRTTIAPTPPPPPTATPSQPTTTTPTAQLAPKTIERPQRPKEEPKEKKPDKPQTSRLEDNIFPPQPKPTSSSAPTKPPPSKPALETKEIVEATTGSLPRDGPKHDFMKPRVSEKADLTKGKGKEPILKEEKKRDIEGSKGDPNYSGVSGGLRGLVAGRGMNEDRKLLVNVGVGFLIIAALGVHVSYTMGLIGKEK